MYWPASSRLVPKRTARQGKGNKSIISELISGDRVLITGMNGMNRFYYALEVSSQGGPQNPPDADTHGFVFHRLYQQKTQGHWEVRFVRGGAPWHPRPKPSTLGIILNPA